MDLPKVWMVTPLKIFVLPVSGGRFPAQLGQLSEICSLVGAPDLVLGSSGGNISAFAGMAGRWTSQGIKRVSAKIRSNHFLSPWMGKLAPSALAFPLTGSIYGRGTGITDLLREEFPEEESPITRTEVWSGAYDTRMRLGQMFCNRAPDDSILSQHILSSDARTYNCAEPIYCSGNISLLADVCYASAALPFIVGPAEINKKAYIDGGVMFASPLLPLQGAIKELSLTEGRPIHMFYFEPYDLNTYYDDTTLYGEFISTLLHASVITDRAFGISIISHLAAAASTPRALTSLNDIPHTQIPEVMKSTENMFFSLYHSESSRTIEITSFNGTDVIKEVESSRQGINVRVWTSGS